MYMPYGKALPSNNAIELELWIALSRHCLATLATVQLGCCTLLSLVFVQACGLGFDNCTGLLRHVTLSNGTDLDYLVAIIHLLGTQAWQHKRAVSERNMAECCCYCWR
jgi:hypothetical protein